MLGNVVTVLTNRAVPAEQIDALVAQEQLTLGPDPPGPHARADDRPRPGSRSKPRPVARGAACFADAIGGAIIRDGLARLFAWRGTAARLGATSQTG